MDEIEENSSVVVLSGFEIKNIKRTESFMFLY